jgi:hypothetical protein
MRTKLKIRTETDYLQAHLTVIEGESRARNPTLYDLNQRVRSLLNEWILAANANLTAQSNPLLRRRSGFGQVQIWHKDAQDVHHREE